MKSRKPKGPYLIVDIGVSFPSGHSHELLAHTFTVMEGEDLQAHAEYHFSRKFAQVLRVDQGEEKPYQGDYVHPILN